MNNWLLRKKACLCIGLGLCVLSIFILVSPGDFNRQGAHSTAYTVTLRHYGVDAREMERSAAIPLEDALSAISGVRNVLSFSENGMVRGVVHFDRGRSGQYEAVREAAQSVYETLPSSAQRPEILGSDNSRIPVWSAAVFAPSGTVSDTAVLLERILKPHLEALEGSGEVEVSGAGLTEIIIALNPDKAVSLGLSPSAVAAALGMNDVLLSGGNLRDRDREFTITVDGRYRDSSALALALIPLGGGRTVRLNEIASVLEQEREPDIFSRLDGKRAAVISIMGSSGADLGKLSREIKRELANTQVPLEYTILSDRGDEETAALRSVLFAALQGSCLVALMSAVIGRSGNKSGRQGNRTRPTGLICALSVPGVCVVSAALLSLLGYPMDRSILAGLSAGVGAAVDAVIICTDRLTSCGSAAEARSGMRRLCGPLISGSVTTIASLLPLGFAESTTGLIRSMAWAIGMVTLVSLIFALTLLPPLFLWDMKNPEVKRPAVPKDASRGVLICVYRCVSTTARRIRRFCLRLLAADMRLCVSRPGILIAAGIAISIAGAAALIINGADAGIESSGDSVYAHIEFEGGLRAEAADRLLAEYAEKLKETSGESIKSVQTSARTASGSVLISFDNHKAGPDQIRSLAKSVEIPGGFIFFPETSSGERNWEIKIFGDEDQKCREKAEELARLCAFHPLVRETVLNFKEGSRRITFVPDRERLNTAGVLFSDAMDTLRRGVHGPVAYKRINSERETDVRVRWNGAGTPSRKETEGILINAADNTASITLDSLVKTKEGREPAGIRREDRRRTASITISTKPMDPRRVKQALAGTLDNLELPPGYTVEFDRGAIQRAEALSGTVLSFLLALLFCYMVIASVNESFTLPLAILSVVPPSLAIPALFLAAGGQPVNPVSACSFVAVSGMAVNASVLCADGLRFFAEKRKIITPVRLYLLLRERLPCLLATGGTTIAGALPFLFLREGTNSFVRSLSLVTALGVASSCVCSVSFLPALLVIFRKIFIFFHPETKGSGYSA
ncbi:MAG: efflux RND transporter permease subunit [Treponema sp.]|jgi:multidrug efflux pump subunit AcrB|nr:efflux RND transporter permease subunit [Treponema sp.]